MVNNGLMPRGGQYLRYNYEREVEDHTKRAHAILLNFVATEAYLNVESTVVCNIRLVFYILPFILRKSMHNYVDVTMKILVI